MNKHSYQKILRLAVYILAAVLAACNASTLPAKQSGAHEIQAIVEASDLASAFEESEIRAAELYRGKRARITGFFARAEPLPDGHIAMTFKISKNTFRPVRCIFDAANSIELNRLAAGDTVAITGSIAGFTGSKYFVTVEDCVVEESKQ